MTPMNDPIPISARGTNGHAEHVFSREPDMEQPVDLLFRVLEVVASRAKETDEAVTRALERWNKVHSESSSKLLDMYTDLLTRCVRLETERSTERQMSELSMEASTNRATWISLTVSILGVVAMVVVNILLRR